MDKSSRDRELTGGLFCLGLFLALGLIVSAYLLTQTLKDIRSSGQTIRVKGYAETLVVSDKASWEGRFVVRGDDLPSSSRALDRARGQILKWMNEQGVPAGGLTFSPVSTLVRYVRDSQGYETSRIESYILEQTVSLKSGDIPLVTRIARDSSFLIGEGLEFISYPPSFFFSGLEGLKLELLGQATTNALERARQLAENSGSAVGNLRSASQGVFQITPVDSTEVADYGRYDTSTVDKLVKAVVTMEYAIVRP